MNVNLIEKIDQVTTEEPEKTEGSAEPIVDPKPAVQYVPNRHDRRAARVRARKARREEK